MDQGGTLMQTALESCCSLLERSVLAASTLNPPSTRPTRLRSEQHVDVEGVEQLLCFQLDRVLT